MWAAAWFAAADHHGNGQADELANQGTAAHGPLDPHATWTRLADFANKVYHFSNWRLVGPQLRIVGKVFPEAPFQLGPRQRV
eukprot:1217423-Amphidinium_carterae.1